MIYGQEIKTSIANAASRCEASCYIASAYCKAHAFEDIFINPSIRAKVKILFLRWQLSDLLSGASDLDVYPLAKKHGWEVFINPRLHAKVYRFDDDCFIGSANLTHSGLTGDINDINLEVVTKVETNDQIRDWFLQLINNSRNLDDELYNQIKSDYETYLEEYKNIESVQYSLRTQHLFNKNFTDNLFTHDFMWSETPQSLLSSNNEDERGVAHDILLLRLNYPISKQDLINAFHQTKAFHWILKILLDKREIYFGELTSLLHDTLQDDPGPYRKSVKILLNTLIKWMEYCSNDIFLIDQPHISTRIRLIENL